MSVETISTLPNPPSKDDPDNFDVETDQWLGAGPLFQSELNALGDELDEIGEDINNVTFSSYKATSSTSIVIALGDKSFTLIESNKGFVSGMSVKMAKTTDPGAVYMTGIVKSYSGNVLVVDVNSITDPTGFLQDDLGGYLEDDLGGYLGSSTSCDAWSISVIPEGDTATLDGLTYDEVMATVHLLNYQNLGGSC